MAIDRAKNIFGAIALVTGVIILIAIASLIVGSILQSNVFTTESGTNSDETLTNVSNITAKDFAILSTLPNAVCTLSAVVNATGGETIAAANYTESTTCRLIATDEGAAGDYNNTDWNITYSYTDNSGVIINVTTLTDGFSAFVLGIVTFLGIIGIIIGIVWLISYLKPLFSREDGIQGFGNN